jgi:biotin carboxylase
LKTTAALHLRILDHPKFLDGDVTTHFLDDNFAKK